MRKKGTLGHGDRVGSPELSSVNLVLLSQGSSTLTLMTCPFEILHDVPINPLGLFFTAWDLSAMWVLVKASHKATLPTP